MKQCSKCLEHKSEEHFSKRKQKNGIIILRKDCKRCRCLIEKKRREENLDLFREKDKKYYENNKEIINAKAKKYREKNSVQLAEQKKEYYKKNKEKIKEYHRINKSKRNERVKKRNAENPIFRIQNSLRSRLHEVLNKKTQSTFSLIGISNTELKKWLEYNFKDGMNWENYGIYWVIDHIIPVAFFNFEIKDEQHKCFNWMNLQPLFKTDNMKKSDKLYEKEIIEHTNTIEKYVHLNEGYQAYYESSMWQRVKLWYGKKSTDEESFKNFLKWTISSQASKSEKI